MALIPSILLLIAQGPAVSFDEHPVDGQLYPRNANNIAQVRVAGKVLETGWALVTVVAKRDGVSFAMRQQALNYSTTGAPFDLKINIHAELASYDFAIFLRSNTGRRMVATAQDVVAGDAFLIQGQSNAVASDHHDQNLANQNQSEWIRSFGTTSLNGNKAAADVNWYTADGEYDQEEGAIGAWGLRMASNIVASEGIPVAILNGAVGATPISFHRRNDADPTDTSTNYGRLLTRALNAGIANNIRAIFWYQGEADGDNADPYVWRFRSLYQDWLTDFPTTERVYVFQVRNGCGNPSVELRNVQRRFKEFLSRVEVMSTTGTGGHDGCHFYYGGYRQLGDRISRQVARDLYGSTDTHEIDPPYLGKASWYNSAGTTIKLEFADPDDSIVVEPGAEQDFVLEDGVVVISTQVVGNFIYLNLSGPTNSNTIAYQGHPNDGAWIRNGRGVGALAFTALIQ